MCAAVHRRRKRSVEVAMGRSWWYVDVIRTLANDRGWSKQKAKSIRGQVIAMDNDREREAYLRKIIRSGR